MELISAVLLAVKLAEVKRVIYLRQSMIFIKKIRVKNVNEEEKGVGGGSVCLWFVCMAACVSAYVCV